MHAGRSMVFHRIAASESGSFVGCPTSRGRLRDPSERFDHAQRHPEEVAALHGGIERIGGAVKKGADRPQQYCCRADSGR